MEERQDKNPYAYDTCRSLLPGRRGRISARTMDRLWEKGNLREEDLIIVSALYELTVLTAKQIEMIFNFEEVPPALKRFRSLDGKNPYRTCIKRLVEYGIVEELWFWSGNTAFGAAKYRLSAGAVSYIKKEKESRTGLFRKNIPKRFKRDINYAQELDYYSALSLLSVNLFHIRQIEQSGARLLSLGRAWIGYNLPINIYQSCNKDWLFVWTERMRKNVLEQFPERVERIEDVAGSLPGKGNQAYYICIVESAQAALSLKLSIGPKECENLFFITDHDVYENDLMGYLMKVRENGEYIRCGLSAFVSERNM